MSEEAQEARNKEIRRYRESFTRKTSRHNTNEDLLKRLLISSDPYITSLRKSIKKPKRTLSNSCLELLDVGPYTGAKEEEDSCSLSSSNAESDCMF